MTTPMIRRFFLALVAALVPLVAAAQATDAKPIHVVVPFPPGGPTDVLGRLLGQALGDTFGQTVGGREQGWRRRQHRRRCGREGAARRHDGRHHPCRQHRGESDAVREPAVQGCRPRAGDDARDRRQRPRRQRRVGVRRRVSGAARSRGEEARHAHLCVARRGQPGASRGRAARAEHRSAAAACAVPRHRSRRQRSRRRPGLDDVRATADWRCPSSESGKLARSASRARSARRSCPSCRRSPSRASPKFEACVVVRADGAGRNARRCDRQLSAATMRFLALPDTRAKLAAQEWTPAALAARTSPRRCAPRARAGATSCASRTSSPNEWPHADAALVAGALTLDDLQRLHAGGKRRSRSTPWRARGSAPAPRSCSAPPPATRPVYGVNTGFGKLAGTRIGANDLALLQLNLIRSHSVGVGAPLARARSCDSSLALKAAEPRARPLGRAREGHRRDRRGPQRWARAVRSVAGVGRRVGRPCAARAPDARADRRRRDVARRRARSGGAALHDAGLAPLVLEAKEGLALINGTQVSHRARAARAVRRSSRCSRRRSSSAR